MDGAIDGDTDKDGYWDSSEKWKETSPNDQDSDDDGISDKDETVGSDYWYEDYDEDGLINAVDPDSDDDNLYDGLERGYKPSNVTGDTDLTRPYFVPDPDHKTTKQYDDDSDPRTIKDSSDLYRSVDTDDDHGKNRIFSYLYRSVDKDTIKDGTEDVFKIGDFSYLYRGVDKDANHNGKIDGDNGDGVWSESEIWTELNPNDQDTDGDTFSDNDEKTWGYNPLSIDTDGDGLSDNDEDKNGNGVKDATETSVKNSDTDGDGLSDKMELDGWTVIIVYEATLEIKEERVVDSNPLIADYDQDGINDCGEFENGTDPNDDDTDDDGFKDKEEIDYDYGSSPTGIDGQAPTISDFKCDYALRTETSGPWHSIKITMDYVVKIWISADDIYGLEWVNVHLEGVDHVIVYTGDVTSIDNEKFEFTLSLEKAVGSLFNSFNVNITASDQNGNVGYKREVVPSIVKILENLNGELINLAEYIFNPFEWMKDVATSIINLMIEKTTIVYDDIYSYSELSLKNYFSLFESSLSSILNKIKIIRDIERFINDIFSFILEIISKYITDKFIDLNLRLEIITANILLNNKFYTDSLEEITSSEVFKRIYENIYKLENITKIITIPIFTFINKMDIKLSTCLSTLENILIKVLKTSFPENKKQFDNLISNIDFSVFDELFSNNNDLYSKYNIGIKKATIINSMNNKESAKGTGAFLFDNWYGNLLFGKNNSITYTAIFIDYTLSIGLGEYSLGFYASLMLGGELLLWIYGNKSEGFEFIPSVYFVVTTFAIEWGWTGLIPVEAAGLGLILGGLNFGVLITDGYDITGFSVQFLIWTRGLAGNESVQAEWWNVGTSIPCLPFLKCVVFIAGRHNIFGKGAKQYNI